MIGTVLSERYRLERPIGTGGFSTVYLATNLRLGNRCAVKILLDEGDRSEFIREAKIVKDFEHPHVVRILDVIQPEEEEIPYLVMEFVDGRSLGERLRAGQSLNAKELLRLVEQIGSALGDAHLRGVIHRDLKPDNIIVVEKPGVPLHFVLVDFGIAACVNSTKTMRNAVYDQAGSLFYMSPEQIRGEFNEDLASRIDVYSFGVILYQLISGRLPYSSTNEAGEPLTQYALQTSILTNSPARLTCLDNELILRRAALQELLYDCMRKSPEDRAETIQSVCDRFRSILSSPPGNTAESVTSEPEPPKANRTENRHTFVPHRQIPSPDETSLTFSAAPSDSQTVDTDPGPAAVKQLSRRPSRIRGWQLFLVSGVCLLLITVLVGGLVYLKTYAKVDWILRKLKHDTENLDYADLWLRAQHVNPQVIIFQRLVPVDLVPALQLESPVKKVEDLWDIRIQELENLADDIEKSEILSSGQLPVLHQLVQGVSDHRIFPEAKKLQGNPKDFIGRKSAIQDEISEGKVYPKIEKAIARELQSKCEKSRTAGAEQFPDGLIFSLSKEKNSDVSQCDFLVAYKKEFKEVSGNLEFDAVLKHVRKVSLEEILKPSLKKMSEDLRRDLGLLCSLNSAANVQGTAVPAEPKASGLTPHSLKELLKKVEDSLVKSGLEDERDRLEIELLKIVCEGLIGEKNNEYDDAAVDWKKAYEHVSNKKTRSLQAVDKDFFFIIGHWGTCLNNLESSVDVVDLRTVTGGLTKLHDHDELLVNLLVKQATLIVDEYLERMKHLPDSIPQPPNWLDLATLPEEKKNDMEKSLETWREPFGKVNTETGTLSEVIESCKLAIERGEPKGMNASPVMTDRVRPALENLLQVAIEFVEQYRQRATIANGVDWPYTVQQLTEDEAGRLEGRWEEVFPKKFWDGLKQPVVEKALGEEALYRFYRQQALSMHLITGIPFWKVSQGQGSTIQPDLPRDAEPGNHKKRLWNMLCSHGERCCLEADRFNSAFTLSPNPATSRMLASLAGVMRCKKWSAESSLATDGKGEVLKEYAQTVKNVAAILGDMESLEEMKETIKNSDDQAVQNKVVFARDELMRAVEYNFLIVDWVAGLYEGQERSGLPEEIRKLAETDEEFDRLEALESRLSRKKNVKDVLKGELDRKCFLLFFPDEE
jgi:serine/threonine protein kinase